jgi:hypothetical protein
VLLFKAVKTKHKNVIPFVERQFFLSCVRKKQTNKQKRTLQIMNRLHFSPNNNEQAFGMNFKPADGTVQVFRPSTPRPVRSAERADREQAILKRELLALAATVIPPGTGTTCPRPQQARKNYNSMRRFQPQRKWY